MRVDIAKSKSKCSSTIYVIDLKPLPKGLPKKEAYLFKSINSVYPHCYYIFSTSLDFKQKLCFSVGYGNIQLKLMSDCFQIILSILTVNVQEFSVFLRKQ